MTRNAWGFAVFAAITLALTPAGAVRATEPWTPKVTLSIADQSAIPALPPEIVIESDVDADLVLIDMTTPDDRRVMIFEITDDMPRGRRFAYPLPITETAKGRYFINYSLSRTNADGSSDAESKYITFWIGDKPEDE